MALPDGVRIRRGVPAEPEALARLHLDVWDDVHAGLMPQEILDERRAKLDERIAAEPIVETLDVSDEDDRARGRAAQRPRAQQRSRGGPAGPSRPG